MSHPAESRIASAAAVILATENETAPAPRSKTAAAEERIRKRLGLEPWASFAFKARLRIEAEPMLPPPERCRRSGRTTRRIVRALALLEAGHPVLIVGHKRQYAAGIEAKVRALALVLRIKDPILSFAEKGGEPHRPSFKARYLEVWDHIAEGEL